jgi:hypothetical protein
MMSENSQSEIQPKLFVKTPSNKRKADEEDHVNGGTQRPRNDSATNDSSSNSNSSSNNSSNSNSSNNNSSDGDCDGDSVGDDEIEVDSEFSKIRDSLGQEASCVQIFKSFATNYHTAKVLSEQSPFKDLEDKLKSLPNHFPDVTFDQIVWKATGLLLTLAFFYGKRKMAKKEAWDSDEFESLRRVFQGWVPGPDPRNAKVQRAAHTKWYNFILPSTYFQHYHFPLFSLSCMMS